MTMARLDIAMMGNYPVLESLTKASVLHSSTLLLLQNTSSTIWPPHIMDTFPPPRCTPASRICRTLSGAITHPHLL